MQMLGIKGTSMSDEDLYLQATNEVENEEQESALWAKALALVEGDAARAKYEYIKLRVEQIKNENHTIQHSSDWASTEGLSNHITGQPESKKRDGRIMNVRDSDLGFTWWRVWAWLGLTLGNLYTFSLVQELPAFAILLIIANSILMVMILSFNKYAFLIATILSLNPLAWIINGIYLKNRWNHPRVNKGSYQAAESNEIETIKIQSEKGVDEDLFEATRAGDIARVKVLIKSGANPRAKDSLGRSPADYARGHGFSEVEQFLKGEIRGHNT